MVIQAGEHSRFAYIRRISDDAAKIVYTGRLDCRYRIWYCLFKLFPTARLIHPLPATLPSRWRVSNFSGSCQIRETDRREEPQKRQTGVLTKTCPRLYDQIRRNDCLPAYRYSPYAGEKSVLRKESCCDIVYLSRQALFLSQRKGARCGETAERSRVNTAADRCGHEADDPRNRLTDDTRENRLQQVRGRACPPGNP